MAPAAPSALARSGLVLLGLAGFGRHPLAHLHAGGHVAVRLPGRVPALGPVGGGHHHRRGVRAPRPDRRRVSRSARWCGSAPSPMAPISGTTRSSSTWTPPAPALSGLSLLAVRSACTFALAAASYYLVERPVMYGTFWRSLKAAVPAIVLMVGTVAVVVAGTVAPATAAVRVKVNDVMPIAERQALTSVQGVHHPSGEVPAGRGLAGVHPGRRAQRRHRQPVRRPTHRQDRPRLRPRRSAGRSPMAISPTRSRPCTAWRTLWRDQVAQYRPDVVGLLIGRWDITDHLDNGTVVHIGQPAWDEHLDRGDRPGGEHLLGPAAPRWCCSPCPTSTRRRPHPMVRSSRRTIRYG